LIYDYGLYLSLDAWYSVVKILHHRQLIANLLEMIIWRWVIMMERKLIFPANSVIWSFGRRTRFLTTRLGIWSTGARGT